MNLSDDGRARLEQREGRKNKAYRDTKGLWTIGVGHTGPNVHEGLAWTDQQIDDAFKDDVKWAETAVNKWVTVPLTQHQFDALVSFVFNIGDTRFRTSTVLRQLNIKDYHGAAQAFMMWNKPPEIVGRRKSEMLQFMEA